MGWIVTRPRWSVRRTASPKTPTRYASAASWSASSESFVIRKSPWRWRISLITLQNGLFGIKFSVCVCKYLICWSAGRLFLAYVFCLRFAAPFGFSCCTLVVVGCFPLPRLDPAWFWPLVDACDWFCDVKRLEFLVPFLNCETCEEFPRGSYDWSLSESLKKY